MLDIVLFGFGMGIVATLYQAAMQRLDDLVSQRWPHWHKMMRYAAQTVGAFAWWAGVFVLDGVIDDRAGLWAAFEPLIWMLPGNLSLLHSARWHLWAKRHHDQAGRERQAEEERIKEAVHMLRWVGCRVEQCAPGQYDVSNPGQESSLLDMIYDQAELVRFADAVRVAEMCREFPALVEGVILEIPGLPPRPGWSVN